MRMLYMRHGQSEYNPLGLCNDRPERNVRLTATGRDQATRAAQALRDEPIEQIFCSRLPRTRETAEIVNRLHGVEIQAHPGIDDIRSGCDGRPVQAYVAAIAHDRLNARVGDGETLLEHKVRVMGFLDWLAGQTWSCTLVVAHEETLRVFYAYAEGLSDAVMIDLAFGNCEVHELRL